MQQGIGDIWTILQQSLPLIVANRPVKPTNNPMVDKIVSIYEMILNPDLQLPHVYILHTDARMNDDLSNFEQAVYSSCICDYLRPVVSYFVSELMCNVEQHADVPLGYGIVHYDSSNRTLLLGIADGGISIYGSYTRAQKYQNEIGDSDAQALYLAQNGYSTKNLPDAENRGYGISSNAKLIVEGLSGAFSIVSGNALFYRAKGVKQIITLPNDIDWPGTLVLAEIPLPNQVINLYKYIN